jgi:hypothetical protein
MPEQVKISAKLIGSADLDHIAEPLTQIAEVEKQYYYIFEAAIEQTVVQTIAITILPHSIPLLKEVGRVVFDQVLGRVLDVFARMPGQKHVFYQDFKVDRQKGVIDGRLLMESKDLDLMRKALRTGSQQFEKALQLMENDLGPADHQIVYGVEFDEATVRFKIRRKDVTAADLKEYDEDNDTWKTP